MQQGLNAIMEVFVVSFVTSTISALVLLLTGAWQSGQSSAAAVALAFESSIPVVGGWVVAFCVFLFGYTTLIGWAYYGEQFLAYLLGRSVAVPYRWIYCLLIPFGAMARVDVVWAWGDLMNALQVFPNIVGLLALSGAGRARRARAHDVAGQLAPTALSDTSADSFHRAPRAARRACDALDRDRAQPEQVACERRELRRRLLRR